LSPSTAIFTDVLEPTFPLTTVRLDLRPYTDDDLGLVRELSTDESVVRYLYWGVQTEDEIRAALAKKKERRALRAEKEGLNLVAVLRETGESVGDVVLFWVSEVHQLGEVGFALRPEFQARGLATEMTAEMLRVGFEDVGLRRIIGRLDARNTASAAVLERLGMRREAHLVDNEWVKGEWCSELDYALLADEWATFRAKRSSA
jgi:RimJ/RimL family protein N-acetyltransferase